MNKIISVLRNRSLWLYEGLTEFYAKFFMKAPKVLTIDETLDLIINQHYSIGRNGDGELNIMMGREIPFQHQDSRLAAIMREAHNAEIPRYISCIPDVFEDTSHFNSKAQQYYKSFLHTNRYHWYRLAKAPIYGNSFISRFYMDYKDKSGSGYRVDRLKQICRGQDVVLVEGKDSRLGVGNDLFEGANSLVRVLGPSENAFDRYDEIMNYVKTNANQNTLILLALGPTATALAYELAKAGYWAVDIGHIDIEYEWFLMGATSKVNVPGKYTNESTGDKISGSLPEEAIKKYQKEIITSIY